MGSISWFVTVTAGALATTGAIGLFMAPVFKDHTCRPLIFKVWTYGFSLCGVTRLRATDLQLRPVDR